MAGTIGMNVVSGQGQQVSAGQILRSNAQVVCVRRCWQRLLQQRLPHLLSQVCQLLVKGLNQHRLAVQLGLDSD